MKRKKALITGITGQDGAYLSRFLLKKGYRVIGAVRRTSDRQLSRLKLLGVDQKIDFVPFELTDYSTIMAAIKKIRPDEIYNLAAQSSVAFSFKEPLSTLDVSGSGPVRVLEAIKAIDPKIRFYQASSSEMFGNVSQTPQNEKTPFRPRSPYAVARLTAHWMTINYRETYGLFACSGILYNHESPLRSLDFVSRKITNAAVRIQKGELKELNLGNLDTERDWGYAPEYVEAMWMMLNQSKPDDYVIAAGESHNVREFVEIAFSCVGIKIEWKGWGVQETGRDQSSGRVIVRINPAYFRPIDVSNMRGDASKARRQLGWIPRTGFAELVHIMVDYERKHAAL
jgi:GDPmannose 4,6-dehydratase